LCLSTSELRNAGGCADRENYRRQQGAHLGVGLLTEPLRSFDGIARSCYAALSIALMTLSVVRLIRRFPEVSSFRWDIHGNPAANFSALSALPCSARRRMTDAVGTKIIVANTERRE
jgi:hypothetical protein